MKILLVAATEFELHDTFAHLDAMAAELIERELYVATLVTGVGMVATTFQLCQYLSHNHIDFVLQAGVAGSFRPKYKPGALVSVASDAFGDLGAEDNGDFLDLFQLNLASPNTPPFDNKLLFATEDSPFACGKDLPQVHAITVNTVAGTEATAAARRKKFAADIESMEGAAFHYVCTRLKVPFAQVRSISNYVAARDKSSWQMKDALAVLNRYLINYFNSL